MCVFKKVSGLTRVTLDTSETLRSQKSSIKLGTAVPSRNGLVQSLCFIVTKRYPAPAVMLEAELDKLNAVHEWKTYGFRPVPFSTAPRRTITWQDTKIAKYRAIDKIWQAAFA